MRRTFKEVISDYSFIGRKAKPLYYFVVTKGKGFHVMQDFNIDGRSLKAAGYKILARHSDRQTANQDVKRRDEATGITHS